MVSLSSSWWHQHKNFNLLLSSVPDFRLLIDYAAKIHLKLAQKHYALRVKELKEMIAAKEVEFQFVPLQLLVRL